MPFLNGNFTILKRLIKRITSKKHPWKLVSSWRRNRALFDSLRPRRETKKRSLRSLRYRNGISHISGDSLSRITQGKQRNAIVMTQTIPLARIVLSISEAYSWNK